MLIITRNPGQSTSIGPDIKVVILGVEGKQVRIGIEAPMDVRIERDNIVNRGPAKRRGGNF